MNSNDYGPKPKSYNYKIARVKHNRKKNHEFELDRVFRFKTKNMINEYKINNLDFSKLETFVLQMRSLRQLKSNFWYERKCSHIIHWIKDFYP